MADRQWTITFTYNRMPQTMSGNKDGVIAKYRSFVNNSRFDRNKLSDLKMTNPEGKEVPFDG